MFCPLVRRVSSHGVCRLISLAVTLFAIALSTAGVMSAQGNKTQSAQTGLSNLQRMDIMRSKLEAIPAFDSDIDQSGADLAAPHELAKQCIKAAPARKSLFHADDGLIGRVVLADIDLLALLGCAAGVHDEALTCHRSPGGTPAETGMGLHGLSYYPGKEESHVGRISNPAREGRIGNPAHDLSCRSNMLSSA